MNSNLKRIAAFFVVVLVALAAVGAYAYFTSTGTGSGTSTVGTSTVWQITTLAATGGPLTPGGAAGTYQAVAYNVKNNSTGQQNLANVTISVANTDGSAFTQQPNTGKPACTASDFQLSLDAGTTFAAAGAAVVDASAAGNKAPGATTANATVTIKMRDNGLNQDNCKGLTVPLYFVAA